MKLSKRQAAAAQIDGAIDHFFLQSIACAITLAGAAEYSLPDPSDAEKSLFHRLQTDGPGKLGISKKKVIAKINEVRDWLKHNQKDQDAKEVDQKDALYMILRAYTKYTACYGDCAATPRMLDFEDYIRRNHSEIIGD